ncbi:MAG: thiamine phosphate synthase [Alphaproteobacteria bacterium]
MPSTAPRLPKRALRLYLVFGPQDLRPNASAPGLINAAVEGGVTCVQWRDKTETAAAPLDTRVAAAQPAFRAARAQGVPFLINDDVSLAAALGADGVHLGQDDLPPIEARAQLGPDAVIGWSVGTAEERARLDLLRTQDPALIDYIGVGPAFTTGTKADAGAALGSAGINAVIEGLDPALPIVAIGGISLQTLPHLREARVDGIAVVSALTRSSDPRATAQALLSTA